MLRRDLPIHLAMMIFSSRLFVTVLLITVAAAAWAYVRWRRSLDNAWVARRGVPWWTFGTLAAVLLVTGAMTYRHDRLEQRLAHAAGAAVGAPVTVHCQSVGGAMTDATAELGYVRWQADGVPEHATTIKYEQCRDLKAYLRHSGRHPTPAEVIAVHVLTHESMHMRGQTNEALAECEAVQRDASMARDLGASASDAAALARMYWRIDYPLMPDDYRSGDCQPGGSLDEHLPDGWPGG